MLTAHASTILRQAAGYARLKWRDLTADAFALLRNELDNALDTAWREAQWPELCRIEWRMRSFDWWTTSGSFTAGTSYIYHPQNALYLCVVNAAGTDGPPDALPGSWVKVQRTWTGEDYDSTVGGSQGNVYFGAATPAHYYCFADAPASTAITDTAYFYPLPEIDQDFAKVDADYPDDMDDVFRVHESDPRVPRGACELKFTLGDDVVTVRDDPAAAWFHYRIPRPRIEGDRLDLSLNYVAGEQVYWEPEGQTTGNFYTCLVDAVAGETPSNTPASWDLVEIPRLFQQFLTYATWAGVERCEGQGDRAVSADQQARYYLDEQVRRLLQQQQQESPLAVAMSPGLE